jgi:hypothetical protein
MVEHLWRQALLRPGVDRRAGTNVGIFTRVRKHARKPGGPVRRRQFLLGLIVAVAACGQATQPPRPAGPAEWLEFEGSWNGTGSRQTISLGEGRVSSIVDLKGTMLLAGPDRPGVGFHSQVIGLVDSATGFQGRSVWTDEHGDQVFSELQGEGTAAKNRITGTILSGTGRYAGATGSYEFSWQWVMEAEDGSIQGRAVDLKGRVRPGPAVEGSPR